jgi:hypothetical protein
MQASVASLNDGPGDRNSSFPAPFHLRNLFRGKATPIAGFVGTIWARCNWQGCLRKVWKGDPRNPFFWHIPIPAFVPAATSRIRSTRRHGVDLPSGECGRSFAMAD